MTRYKLSPAAQTDLIDIRRYTLENWGGAQWTNYFGELKQSMALLASNELIGIDMPELGTWNWLLPLSDKASCHLLHQETGPYCYCRCPRA